VALHILKLVILDKEASEELSLDTLKKIKFVHFVKENEFEEIEQFRHEIEADFGITVQLFSSDFKREVGRLIEEQGIKAIIMGNRRTDPWSADLKPMTESSAGWPAFMRIFPIINWDYRTVWAFLRGYSLKYCSLYDKGFTSLGEKHNSVPNPHLKIVET
jgi:FAD synthetase